MTTTLVKRQRKTYGPRFYTEHGQDLRITAEVRHDDDCGNGHNSFSITATIDRQAKNGRWTDDCGGCLHDEVAKHFPELAPYIKWHLTSTDGPMHYVDNSLYWAGKSGWTNGGPNDPPNLEHFRRTAVWPSATIEDMQAIDSETLNARLGCLMDDFRKAVESLGFTY